MTHHSKVCERFEGDLLLQITMDGRSFLSAGSGAYHIYHRSLAGWPGYENLLDSVDEAEIVISDSLPRTIP